VVSEKGAIIYRLSAAILPPNRFTASLHIWAPRKTGHNLQQFVTEAIFSAVNLEERNEGNCKTYKCASRAGLTARCDKLSSSRFVLEQGKHLRG
jgi:hypothetical protein